MNGLLAVGDVIVSPKFAYGYKNNEESSVITIDGKPNEHLVEYSLSEDERVKIAAKTGKIPPKSRLVNLEEHDGSRGQAEFVVVRAESEGGGTGMGPHDVYPDGWHVTAKRLTKKGKYDPNGETIEFYMTGCFNCMVAKEDITFVRTMQMKFV